MKKVTWTDSRGYLRRSLIKDDDDETKARYGLPSGPPDLEALDWDAIKKEINNALVKNNLDTWADVQRNSAGLQIALTIFKRHLVSLYRQEAK